MPDHLFVYGTLMQGIDNPFAEKLHNLSVFKGKGYFAGALYQVDWYPGAVYSEKSTSRVYGEIYEIQHTPDLLSELDEYEDVLADETKSLYVRRKVSVQMENESALECWVYLYNQAVENLVKINSGSFRNL